MAVDGGDTGPTKPRPEELRAENARLRAALAKAERRARLAEEQLLRVHRAVRAVKKESRRVRPIVGSRRLEGWNDSDPKLDEKLESYLRHEMEPDRSRDWILGERSA